MAYALDVTSDPLTDRSRRIWSAGDYDRISVGFRDEAASFAGRFGLSAGRDVLDAACGSGNVTIPAARTGATVTGVDIVPQLLRAAQSWAEAEDLAITLDEGSVEALPYEDASFDVVLSMFGVMFAARPEAVVRELARVTRPGGLVALANWTRGGFVGRMLTMHSSLVPPPAEVASPLLWGDEEVLARWFDKDTWEIGTYRRVLTFRYPCTPSGTAELFRSAYGPTVRVFEALNEDRRAQFAAALEDHWVTHQRYGATDTVVDSEYLELVAVRR